MNNLKRDKQEVVIRCLVEGASVRSTERITNVHRDTILRLMVKVGNGCKNIMASEFHDLQCRRVQLDEIWGYVGRHQRRLTEADDQNRTGDFWTFVAIDADTRLVPAYRVGKRNLETTTQFLSELSGRLANRVQISSDAMPSYIEAIDRVFGANVDYGQIVKSYEAEPVGPGRYSPPRVSSIKRSVRVGRPEEGHISTSYVERSNLLMRMSIRRLTRLTDAFSKKLENLEASIALHFGYYNFVRIHRSLRVTPAMEAGVTKSVWTINDLVDACDSHGARSKPEGK